MLRFFEKCLGWEALWFALGPAWSLCDCYFCFYFKFDTDRPYLREEDPLSFQKVCFIFWIPPDVCETAILPRPTPDLWSVTKTNIDTNDNKKEVHGLTIRCAVKFGRGKRTVFPLQECAGQVVTVWLGHRPVLFHETRSPSDACRKAFEICSD